VLAEFNKKSVTSDVSIVDLTRQKENRKMGRKTIMAAMAGAGVVMLVCVTDLAIGFPFGKFSIFMDVLYFISAGIIGYMGYETYQEQS